MKNCVYIKNDDVKVKIRVLRTEGEEELEFKKVMAVWSDEDFSEVLSDEEEEEMNMCFMARGNEMYFKFFFYFKYELIDVIADSTDEMEGLFDISQLKKCQVNFLF